MSFKVPTKPAPRVPVDPDQLASFAAGAEPERQLAQATPPNSSREQRSTGEPPWLGLDDKRRLPAFNMRFTAAEQAKLKFIAERCPESMHEFSLKAIQAAIKERLKTLGQEV